MPKAQGSRLRAQDARLNKAQQGSTRLRAQAQGSELLAQGSERRAQNLKLRAQSAALRHHDAGIKVQGLRAPQGSWLRAHGSSPLAQGS
jgi:hypothetical protein